MTRAAIFAAMFCAACGSVTPAAPDAAFDSAAADTIVAPTAGHPGGAPDSGAAGVDGVGGAPADAGELEAAPAPCIAGGAFAAGCAAQAPCLASSHCSRCTGQPACAPARGPDLNYYVSDCGACP
jgi:hypothetical protein